jgi:uncharacterized protein (DUF983 family)
MNTGVAQTVPRSEPIVQSGRRVGFPGVASTQSDLVERPGESAASNVEPSPPPEPVARALASPTEVGSDELASLSRLLARGFTRRCPCCGDRHGYFEGWFGRLDRCRSCGLDYRRGDDGFELGALTVNIMLTFLSVLSCLLVVFVALPEVPLVAATALSGAVALVAPAAYYPVSFTVWHAIDLWMRRPGP